VATARGRHADLLTDSPAYRSVVVRGGDADPSVLSHLSEESR
jgi:hypothetical protein